MDGWIEYVDSDQPNSATIVTASNALPH
jgi:hypothetical protein